MNKLSIITTITIIAFASAKTVNAEEVIPMSNTKPNVSEYELNSVEFISEDFELQASDNTPNQDELIEYGNLTLNVHYKPVKSDDKEITDITYNIPNDKFEKYVKVNDTDVKYDEIGEYKLTYILEYNGHKTTTHSNISITPSTELSPTRPEAPDVTLPGGGDGEDGGTDNGTDSGTDSGTDGSTDGSTDNTTVTTDNNDDNNPEIMNTGLQSNILAILGSFASLGGLLFLKFKVFI